MIFKKIDFFSYLYNKIIKNIICKNISYTKLDNVAIKMFNLEYESDNYSSLNQINYFIKLNILERINELDYLNPKKYHMNMECVNLLNVMLLRPNINLLKIMDKDILFRLSSKSVENFLIGPNQNIIENRLEGLYYLLNGKNYQTNKYYKQIEKIISYIHIIHVSYILIGQIFTDRNHAVCFKYLLSKQISKSECEKIINQIDYARQIKLIVWENLHEFIQIIINNIVKLVELGENNIAEKIENIFV